MPSTGTIEIWANDLDEGSFDNCTPQDELRFFIRRSDSGDSWETAITLSCDDLPSGYIDSVLVDILVVDNAGNENYCQTYISLQDTPDENGEDVCPDADPADDPLIEKRSDDGIYVFELHQNVPNPFIDETMISWDSPQEGTAIVTVHDLNGRLISRQEISVLIGFNSINVDVSQIKSGVYYFTLVIEDFMASKKMIKL